VMHTFGRHTMGIEEERLCGGPLAGRGEPLGARRRCALSHGSCDRWRYETMRHFIRRNVNRLIERVAESTARRVSSDIVESTAQRLSSDMAEVRNSVNMLRVATILGSASKGTPPNRLFGEVDDDFWYWVHTEGYRRSAALREILPGAPDEKTQFQCVGRVGDFALKCGLEESKVLKKIYEGIAGDFAACNNVLDFGCGWGRTIRFFLKDIDPSRLWGIDTNNEMTTFCQRSFKWCNFRRNEPCPPTSFAEGMFDLVYAVSVFSHLSDDAHRKWLEEFSRILRPGGVLIATTWGRDFITRCREARKQGDLTSVTVHLPTLFTNTEHWLSVYDHGGFCFDSSTEVYPGISDWLGEACIPRGYVLNHWTQRFGFIDYIEAGPLRDVFSQNIIIVKK
jgi:SAM-dependent methyltransferase